MSSRTYDDTVAQDGWDGLEGDVYDPLDEDDLDFLGEASGAGDDAWDAEADMLEDFDALDELDELDELDWLDEFDGLDEFEGLDEFDGLDWMDELDGLDGLDGLDELDGLDDLDELDGLDDFDGLEGFFSKVKGWARKGARAIKRVVKKNLPMFKFLGRAAAKVLGGVIGGPAGAKIAGAIANAVLKQAEASTESAEDALSSIEAVEAQFVAAGGDTEAAAMMEALAYRAATTGDETEANRAIAAMVRHGGSLIRSPQARRYLPQIQAASVALAKTFRADQKTRWAVATLPLILRRTLVELNKKRQITKRTVVEVMAQQTAWVLANPSRAKAAMARSQQVRTRGSRRSVGRGRGKQAPARRRRPTARR